MTSSDILIKVAELDKQIEKTKTLYAYGSITLDQAKNKITRINKKIDLLLKKLPENERDVYKLNKEVRSMIHAG